MRAGCLCRHLPKRCRGLVAGGIRRTQRFAFSQRTRTTSDRREVPAQSYASLLGFPFCCSRANAGRDRRMDPERSRSAIYRHLCHGRTSPHGEWYGTAAALDVGRLSGDQTSLATRRYRLPSNSARDRQSAGSKALPADRISRQRSVRQGTVIERRRAASGQRVSASRFRGGTARRLRRLSLIR